MISLDTDVDKALHVRARQRAMIDGQSPSVQSLLLNPYRYAGANPALAGPVWTAVTLPDTNGSDRICYVGNSTFISHRILSTALILKSTNNGVTWSSVDLGVSGDMAGIASDGAGKAIICCGTSSLTTKYFYTSDYGASWTLGTMPASKNWYAIGYSNGLWMMVDYQGYIYTSTDMVNWTYKNIKGTWNRGIVGNSSQGFVFWNDNGTTLNRTLDGGTNWSTGIAYATNQKIASYDGSRLCLFDSGGNNRKYSDDFGSTFSASAALPSGVNATQGPVYSPTQGGYLLAADRTASSNKLIVSVDGGATWAYTTNNRLNTVSHNLGTNGAGRWVYLPQAGSGSNQGAYADL